MFSQGNAEQEGQRQSLEIAAWAGDRNAQKAFAEYLQPENAFAWLEAAALQGQPEAQYQIAEQYYSGRSYCKKNIKKAFELYFSAAIQGSQEAHARIATLAGRAWNDVKQQMDNIDQYLKKIVDPTQKKEAEKLREEILELILQGKSYSSSINTKGSKIIAFANAPKNTPKPAPDVSTSKKTPESTVEINECKFSDEEISAQEAFQLGRNFFDLEHYQASTTFFLKAAHRGYELAYIYLWLTFATKSCGANAEQNAEKYLQKITPELLKNILIRDTSGEGAYAAGLFYYEKFRRNPVSSSDAKKAFHFFRRASNLGHLGAGHLLGHCHGRGIGTLVDKAKMLALFEDGHKKNHPPSSNCLACCQAQQNRGSRAAHLTFKDAANQDYVTAQSNLGYSYEIGNNKLVRAPDGKKAAKRFLKAEIYNTPEREFKTSEDRPDSEKLFWDDILNPHWKIDCDTTRKENLSGSKSWNADKYDPDLQVVIGDHASAHELPAIAEYWYKQAAAQNHPLALTKLGDLAIHMEQANGAEFYEQAANLNYAPAIGKLAECYRTGKGLGGRNYIDRARAVLLEAKIVTFETFNQAAEKGGDDSLSTIRSYLEQNRYDFEAINKTADANKRTALIHAINRKDVPMATTLLKAEDTDVNAVNFYGNTALTLAAKYGCNEIVIALLERDDFSISIVNQDGDTALHCAASENRLMTIAILLGKMTLQEIMLTNKNSLTAAQKADNKPYPDIAELINIHALHLKAEPITSHRFIEAANSGKGIGSSIVKVYIEQQQGNYVAINAITNKGATALMWAARNGHLGIVITLLAQPGINLTAVDEEGNTALIAAVHFGHDTIASLLLARMTLQEIQIKNKEGLSAALIAQKQNRSTISRLIDLQIMRVAAHPSAPPKEALEYPEPALESAETNTGLEQELEIKNQQIRGLEEENAALKAELTQNKSTIRAITAVIAQPPLEMLTAVPFDEADTEPGTIPLEMPIAIPIATPVYTENPSLLFTQKRPLPEPWTQIISLVPAESTQQYLPS